MPGIDSLSAGVVYSVISIAVCTVLIISAIISPKGRGVIPFALLNSALLLWQLGKVIQNGSVVLNTSVNHELWLFISQLGIFCLPVLFFNFVVSLGNEKRTLFIVFKWCGVSGAILTTIFFGVRLNVQSSILTSLGYFHTVSGIHILFFIQFLVYMGLSFFLLYPAKFKKRPQLYNQARVVFIAAIIGSSLGLVEIINIYYAPITTLSNLAPACYGIVLYWTMFRYDFLSTHDGMRKLTAAGIAVLGYGMLLSAGFFVLAYGARGLNIDLFQYPVVISAIVCIGVLSVSVEYVKKRLETYFHPIERKGRGALLALINTVQKAQHITEMAGDVLRLFEEHFDFYDGSIVLFSRTESGNCYGYETYGSRRSVSVLKRVNLEQHGTIMYQRNIIADMWRYDKTTERYRSAYFNYALLLRLKADVVVPLYSSGVIVGALLCKENVSVSESYEDIRPFLENVSVILGDGIGQMSYLQKKAEKDHLAKVGEITASLAHEIRNPLQGIYGAAQLLFEQDSDSELVSIVLDDTRRLNELVDEFLHYSRPEKMNHSNISVKKWLDSMMVRYRMSGINIAITSVVDDEILYSDERMLTIVLTNLVHNASRYQRPGRPVEISIKKDVGWEVSVMNHGASINPEHVSQLFEPFFTTESKGTGLGLALSKKIARALDGDLYYRPLNPGSCFTLFIKDHNECST
ncbi:MAG: ATP-binding protein [Fibrobacterales bacterium]